MTSQSETFKKLRDKIQGEMKRKGRTYDDVLGVVEYIKKEKEHQMRCCR